MDQFQLAFIDTQDQARVAALEMFQIMFGAEPDRQKGVTSQFLNKINDNLNSNESSPKSKFMSLFILNDVFQNSLRQQTKYNKVFTILLSHNLLKTLERFCGEIDPNKPVQDKGKKYFPKDTQTGQDFIRLSLQLIKMLSYKFPKGKNQDATAFKRGYNKLLQQKVIFPEDYKFTTVNIPKGKDESMGESRREQKNSGSGAEVAPSSRGNSKDKDLVFLESRIKALVQAIQDGQQEQYLNTQIKKLHELVVVDNQKFEKHLNQVMEKGGEPSIIERLLEVQSFMRTQIESYERNMNQRRDLPMYSTQIMSAANNLFPQQASRTPEAPQRSGNIRMTQSKDYDLGSKIREKEEKPAKMSRHDPNAMDAISQYFQNIERKSKSPIAGGFRKINQSLSKQKAGNSSLKSRISPLNRTNFSKSINSLKGSKIAAIFANPPNSSPPPRFYQGHQISQNYAVEDMLKRISKFQGHRRYMTSNFKGKGSLFENQHLQVGFKSEAIYEEVSGFRVLLKIQLYFGNLSEETFRNLSLDFKGDQNILLYANPREIERSAMKGEQNKIDLVIIPLKPQFPLLTMNMRYQIGGGQYEQSVLIPNSALKFLSKGQFLSQWQTASLFKSTEFNLSNYLPPDTLMRWIPSLIELVPYSEFVVPGSKKDYQVCTAMIMMQRYEALLKITVRPNLKVILQFGLQQRNEESKGYFITLLQHLQQFMKQIK